ncbi:uncharacterized protein BX664DRAFT_334879 [Halteromyces radiatus]|uniref:uncharacterized protein n=1 Tax=Halteromyces radiatus TaxID=101107 RepID=UPI00222061F8|nr:uncharacterized protein BX664DRAFT_334879 [Halteromyces radiatus]KAI8086087.1 hypothetical protein BX664DRAFT_334879 [Halteromyces radiatus]
MTTSMNSNYYINNINTDNNNNNNNNNNMNSDLFLTQDPFSTYLFGAATPASLSPVTPITTTPSSSVDEWLADELKQSGLLPLMPDFLKQENNVVDYYLAQQESSPAMTSGSPDSSASSVGSPQTSPVSLGTPPSSSSYPMIATPPLFPDIAPKKPGFRAIAPAKKQLVPIMPKTTNNNNNNNNTPSVNPSSLMSVANHPIHHQVNNKRKIVTDKEQDDIALKRQKNTDAARRSRLKKLVKMETLEKRVVELEADNTRLSTRIAVLESEKSGLESKDKGLEDRIRTLEAQLAEAHKALTGRH